MAELANPEYDRFAAELRDAIQRQQAATERQQEQARRLFEQGEGDVTYTSPSE